MAINAMSGKGRIEVFEDFIANELPVAGTAAAGNLGPFRVVGQGIAESDSGAVALETDGLSGVIQLTTTDEDAHSLCLVTAKMFDVAKMGPIVAEARVRLSDLDTKQVFFGFTDENDDDQIIEGEIMKGATTTLTLTASDICGFYLSDELTDDEDWHGAYNGGTTTGETVSTSVDLDADAVAGEWQILRLEVDPNGTARWYIDENLKQTVEGAVSTTTDLALVIGVHSNTTECQTLDIDYIAFSAGRDWNA